MRYLFLLIFSFGYCLIAQGQLSLKSPKYINQSMVAFEATEQMQIGQKIYFTISCFNPDYPDTLSTGTFTFQNMLVGDTKVSHSLTFDDYILISKVYSIRKNYKILLDKLKIPGLILEKKGKSTYHQVYRKDDLSYTITLNKKELFIVVTK